jgi:hypothetical protein
MTSQAHFTTQVPALLLLLALTGCESGGQTTGNFQGFARRQTEEWTILCAELTGPYHGDNCRALADSLRATADIRAQDVRCDHDTAKEASRLYYGKYRRTRHPRTNRLDTPKSLAEDMYLIFNLADDQNRRLFGTARAVRHISPEGLALRQWALTSATGIYSLQIAVFYPDGAFTQSRQAAVELVAELREQGHQAYYHHGEVMSMVTVGSFDESAVNSRPDGTIQLSSDVLRLQASDPRFKHNYENGRVINRKIGSTKGTTKFSNHSFLVRIPRQAP